MGRAPCCDKANVKKGPWSPDEDFQLKQYIETNGTGGNWISLPHKAGLRRCGKSCRLRWLNYLRPNIKHGEFSAEEDRIICTLFATIGSRWSIIAAQLPGRTDNDIKNYWNTKLKKKLMGFVSSSTNTNKTPQIIKKVQSLPPISHQNASFIKKVQSLSPISNNILNPMAEPLCCSTSSTSIPFVNYCNSIHGCLVTNPFDQCCYETLKLNQIQMGFQFGSGLITSNNGLDYLENHMKLNSNNNGHGNFGENAIIDYDGMLLVENMEVEEQMKKKIKREMEDNYCFY